jgi:two-component system, LytTR family, response regulator
MIRCIIIDDEQEAIDILADYAKESGKLQVVATHTNPVEGLASIEQLQPDVVFLDIHMPKLSGMDLVRTLKGRYKVILCTAYTEFATEAYDYDVLDYLLKPVRFERFLRAISKLETTATTSNYIQQKDDYETDYLFVKTESKRKLLKINIRDIDFIEGMKNYVCIHHNGTRTLALLNMKDMEDRLLHQYFIRTHKSYIVNIQRIIGITDDVVHLKGIDAEVLIGVSYRDAFMNIMREKLMGKPKS